MTGMSWLSLIVSTLSYQTPELVVCIAGIIAATAIRRRCRRAATLVLFALSLTLAVLLLGSVIHVYWLTLMVNGGPPVATDLWIVTAWGMKIAVAIGMAILIAAAFVGRGQAPADD